MEKLSFVLVPYLPADKSFTFANYQFVPLLDVHSYAKNAVLESANIIAGQYLTQMSKPIETVIFVFPTEKQLGEYLEGTQKRSIEEVLKVLYLDSFCHTRQMNIATAENFEPVFYDVVPNDYTLSTISGGIYPLTIINVNMQKISYTTPPYVHLNRGYFIPSERMSPALEYVLTKKTQSLLRATEFFFEAMRNDERRTLLTKTTNLYMAFLMLMKASSNQSERNLWLDFMSQISEPGLPTYTYPNIDTRTGLPHLKKPTLDLNVTQIWGHEFYKLRCKMLHGDELNTDDYAFTDISDNNLVTGRPHHFFLAANIFPVLFFHRFQQEYPELQDSPSFVVDSQEGFSQNFTGLGFEDVTFKPPFYINDLRLRKEVLRTIKPFTS